MATRFYLPSSGSAAASPAYDAAWEDVSNAVRHPTSTAKTGTAVFAQQGGQGTAGAADVLMGQFVSAPLAAQTITGTIKGQIAPAEYDLAVNAQAQLVARVVSGDGATVRGTLCAAHAEALVSEWGLDTAPKNRKFPLSTLYPFTVTNVDAQAGDRLVFEVGGKVGDNGAEAIEMVFGDGLAGDLPADETTDAGTANPWIELSADIAFQAAAAAMVPAGGFTLDCGVNL